MMRPLVKPLPKIIDPWAFARQRETLSGMLLLAQTQTLKQWAATDSAVEVALAGDIDDNQQHRLSGSLAVALQMQCQRCLEMMTLTLNEVFDYVLIAHEDLEHSVVDGSETLICADSEFDVAWFIEEEVLLAIPMIVKHENCSVLHEQTAPASTDEGRQFPFAGLKKLMDSKEQP